MENLITQENLENIREFIEDKISDVPGELILFGAVSALLLSSYLNKTGHKQASTVIGNLSVPILGIGLAKYKDVLKSASQSFENIQQEVA